MKALHIGVSAVALVVLAGCSSGWGNKRIDYRAGSAQVPALEMPPELTAPAVDDQYRTSGGEGGVASYSDYSKGSEAMRPVRSAVLPESKGVRMERDGAQRWLVVEDKAENVWPMVKSFWQENGLTIASEDMAAGVMQTDWAENRAKIPQDAVRSVLGKVFDGLYSSGERDQYRTRLARSADGRGTEIHITHRGMEEVVSSDGSTSKWQARPADPELEAIMLQKLMVRFGSTEVQAAVATGESGSTGAAEGKVAAKPIVPGDGKIKLVEVFDGSKVLVVNDAFDKAWSRVGHAIEKAGLQVEESDRAKGVYNLKQAEQERHWLGGLIFWEDNKIAAQRYRVNLKDGGSSCEVSVTDRDGGADEAATGLLEKIFQHFDQ